MLVTFRSDAHVQRTGFHASFDFLTPTPSPVIPDGQGSSGEMTSSNGGAGGDTGGGRGLFRGGQDTGYDDESEDGDDDDGGQDLLTAIVVEPRWETGHVVRGNYTDDLNFGRPGVYTLTIKTADGVIHLRMD